MGPVFFCSDGRIRSGRAMSQTRITTDVDFGRQGRQVSFLRLTHSDNRHAFATIPIPIAVIANGAGPTALLTAGNHGDEYEGQVILHDLARTLDPALVRGRVIVLPALNYPAVQAGTRVSPLDAGNLNRGFPGDPDGGPTVAIAHYVESVLLPMCQFASDLHSGGASTEYLPCAYLHAGGGPDLMHRKLAGARAFGAPYTMIAKGTSDGRSLSAACDRLGVVQVATELAGGASVSRRAVAIGRAGVKRFLNHAGILADAPRDEYHDTRMLLPLPMASAPMAPCEGVFEPFRDLGATVKAGDVAGRVHPLGELERPSIDMKFSAGGIVAIRRVPMRVNRGDYLYRLAVDVGEAELLA
jgi:uncharacterized protein